VSPGQPLQLDLVLVLMALWLALLTLMFKNIMTPLPEKCALVQKLPADMMSSHRNGLSWEGDIDIGYVDVYDDRDFNWIAQSVLKAFRVLGALIPYLEAFIRMLSRMVSYGIWWSNTETTESLQDLIENHPFLKPAMAWSNL
uniref:Uncharacterized protein n=1 Tax=Setaria italica TaxID=4555 RepID=K3YLD1_SETIT